MSEPADKNDDDFSAHFQENLFATWIDGELERRGQGQTRADIGSAVIELPPLGGAAIIRLNDEVSLQARAVASAAIAKGDIVTVDNVESVESFWPLDVGPNSGWLAYVALGNTGYIAFDLRYNKQRTSELLRLAEQYVEAAETVQKTALRPAVDNLMSAAELTVQAQMLSQADENRLHNVRDKWLRSDVRLGNAPASFSAALRQLSRQRAAARYGDGILTIDLDEFIGLTATVRAMVEHAARRVGVDLADKPED